jgi:hypothetical protein
MLWKLPRIATVEGQLSVVTASPKGGLEVVRHISREYSSSPFLAALATTIKTGAPVVYGPRPVPPGEQIVPTGWVSDMVVPAQLARFLHKFSKLTDLYFGPTTPYYKVMDATNDIVSGTREVVWVWDVLFPGGLRAKMPGAMEQPVPMPVLPYWTSLPGRNNSLMYSGFGSIPKFAVWRTRDFHSGRSRQTPSKL